MRYFAILFCVFIWGAARAENRPIPQLDTGGHMAIIRGLAFTPDGKQLVSAGEDKVIRVWDLASGKTLRTIRGESAAGSLGKILAILLSADGKWLAVAGNSRTPPAQNGREAKRLKQSAYTISRAANSLRCSRGIRVSSVLSLSHRREQADFGEQRQHCDHLGHWSARRCPGA